MSSGGRSCLVSGGGRREAAVTACPQRAEGLPWESCPLPPVRWRDALGLAPASVADPGLFLGCSHTPWLPAEVSLETRLADVLPHSASCWGVPFSITRCGPAELVLPPKQHGLVAVAEQGGDEVSPGCGWQLCHLPGTRGPWGQSPVLPAALGILAWVMSLLSPDEPFHTPMQPVKPPV